MQEEVGIKWGGPVQSAQMGNKRNDFSSQLFATESSLYVSKLIFSRSPIVLLFVITGDADFLFE